MFLGCLSFCAAEAKSGIQRVSFFRRVLAPLARAPCLPTPDVGSLAPSAAAGSSSVMVVSMSFAQTANSGLHASPGTSPPLPCKAEGPRAHTARGPPGNATVGVADRSSWSRHHPPARATAWQSPNAPPRVVTAKCSPLFFFCPRLPNFATRSQACGHGRAAPEGPPGQGGLEPGTWRV